MKSNPRRFFTIILCLVFAAVALPGQEAPVEAIEQYDQEVIEEPFGVPIAPEYRMRPNVDVRELNAGQWEKATKGLDYSKDALKPKRLRNNQDSTRNRSGNRNGRTDRDITPRPSTPFQIGQGFATFMQVVAILLLIGLVGYGAYVILKQPRAKKIASDGTEITLENVEHYIHETDLERFLREALANKDYNQAIRLYYLQMIKDLSLKNAIQWSREKTNRQYLREMRQHPLSIDFQRLTQTFERVWYGNSTLTANDYAALEPAYKSFLSSI